MSVVCVKTATTKVDDNLNIGEGEGVRARARARARVGGKAKNEAVG